MAQKNRELSQFGSFLEIDNTNQNIGIATTATPFVGIGTTNPTVKLTVIGDTNISGNVNVGGAVSASSYSLNGNPLVDAAIQTWDISGSDIYRSQGNVGIGTSTYTEKLTVAGNVSAGKFISTVTTGTSPLSVTSQTLVTNLNADYLRGGIPGSNINSYDIVTLGATQTLTNKTLTAPKISSISNGGTLNLPTTNGTLVSTGDTAVVTSNMIADLSITNTDVAAGAAISYSKLNLSNSVTNSDIASSASIAISKLAASTISGISLGSTLSNLTAGSFINYNSGTTYNGSSGITISVAATTANTANTVICRDASGDFAAGTVNATNLSATQTVSSTNLSATQSISATNFNSTNLNISGVTTFSNGPVNIGVGSTSAQVLKVDGNVHITGNIGIGTTSELSGDNITIYGSNPQIGLYELDATANNKRWILASGNKELYFQAIDDSSPGSGGGNIIAVGRSGNELSYIQTRSATTGQVFFNFDFFNAAIGIGTTVTQGSLTVTGDVYADRYLIGAGNSSTVGTGSTIIAIDASTTQRHSRIASFDGDKTMQISNLTSGREVKIYIRNTSGSNRTITVQASTTTTGFSNVNLSLTTITNTSSVTSVTLAATNGTAVIWVANIAGNLVGSLS